MKRIRILLADFVESRIGKQGAYLFYKCDSCGCLVTCKDIQKLHGCPRCGGGQIRPTNLRLIDEIFLILRCIFMRRIDG